MSQLVAELAASGAIRSHPEQGLFAILDPEILDRAPELELGEIRTLGPEEEPDGYPIVAQVAPSVLPTLLALRREIEWGVLAGGRTDLDGAVEHLRSVLEWRDDEDDPVIVRLFDETVLSPFLEACDETERYWTFGPFDWFARPIPGAGWSRLDYRRPAREGVGERRQTLRPAHYAAFDVQAEAILVDNLIDHLHDEHLGLVENLERDDLEAMVAHGLSRARAHRFENVDDLGAHVAMMFEVAPNFDAHPTIAAELANPDHDGPERWLAILDAVPDEAWDEAEADYDEAAWLPEGAE